MVTTTRQQAFAAGIVAGVMAGAALASAVYEGVSASQEAPESVEAPSVPTQGFQGLRDVQGEPWLMVYEDGSWLNLQTDDSGCLPGALCDDSTH